LHVLETYAQCPIALRCGTIKTLPVQRLVKISNVVYSSEIIFCVMHDTFPGTVDADALCRNLLDTPLPGHSQKLFTKRANSAKNKILLFHNDK